MSGHVTGTDRGSLAGVRMILGYNWPLYVTGLATVATGAALAARRSSPTLLRLAGAAGAGVAGWLSVASVAASWWVYDLSELYRWTWLPRTVRHEPRHIIVMHAGLDEASEPVSRTWPMAAVSSLDVHGGLGRTTASLRLARRDAGRDAEAHHEAHGQLATDTDLVVIFLAAHELRSRTARVELMRRIHHSLVVGGRLVLVEHVRDLSNAVVFGPAIGHFYPVREWRDAIGRGGLDLVAEERITPFITVMTAERSS